MTAPIGGLVGLRQVDAGNIVHASDSNGLVVITQMQPITVLFPIPEDNLQQVIKRVKSGAGVAVDAYDRSQKTKLATGKLLSMDNQIDTSTGTIRLRAEFANDDRALYPNQFVNVRMIVDTQPDATLVPSAAIQRGSPGTFVYIVKDDKTVSVQVVNLGPVQGEVTAIASGIEPGAVVVVDGADKLREGAKVELITPADPAVMWRLPPRRDVAHAATKAMARRVMDPSAAIRAVEIRRRAGSPPPNAQAPRVTIPMNPSRPFIVRPVATSLLMVAILLAGIIAYRVLPLSALPQVDYPTIQVVTLYPGASPDVMTSSVTAPLERQFGQMPGLNQMSSTSSGGASVITLQFSLDLGLDVAEQEVQAAINASGTFLPADLPTPPIYNKVNPADTPIVTLALTSKDAAAAQSSTISPIRGWQRSCRNCPASVW